MKYTEVLIFGFIATACAVTTETNTNNYNSMGIDKDQTCRLKDYQLENNKTIQKS